MGGGGGGPPPHDSSWDDPEEEPATTGYSEPIVESETVKVTEKDLEPDLTLTDPNDFEMPEPPFADPAAGDHGSSSAGNESR